MGYTADKPKVALDTNLLRASIPGWGVDRDPKLRPGVPKERFDPGATGAHWVFPERQVASYQREKSTEHRFLTPVFGTACPPRGVSGLLRRFAYTFSEGRLAHWGLLVFADRVDVIESRVSALLRGHPDNPFSEMGLMSELSSHGLRARIGRGRADVRHLPLDALMFAGSSVLSVAAMAAIVQGVRTSRLFGRRRRLAWLPRSIALDLRSISRGGAALGLGVLAAIGTSLVVGTRRRRVMRRRMIDLGYPDLVE